MPCTCGLGRGYECEDHPPIKSRAPFLASDVAEAVMALQDYSEGHEIDVFLMAVQKEIKQRLSEMK